MFEFVFEGALLPLTYNGDMFVLLALLPRRKPRTAVQPPCSQVAGGRMCRPLPAGINLTGGGYSYSLAAQAAGMDFRIRANSLPCLERAALRRQFTFSPRHSGEGRARMGRGFTF